MLPLVLLLTAAPAGDPPTAKLPIGAGTTVVGGPLDKDGYIDFAAALDARLSKGVTPETNACVSIWQALGPTPEGYELPPDFYQRLGAKPPAGGAYFRPIEPFMTSRGRARDDEFFTLQSRLAVTPWAAKYQPDFAAWLAANETPLAVLADECRRPAYYNPPVARTRDGRPTTLTGGLLPGVQQCRLLGHALSIRAMLRAGEGDYDAAWADILTIPRLARHVARGGTTIELLIGYALDGIAGQTTPAYIAARQPTAAQAAAAIRDLDALPAMPPLSATIDLGERFTMLDVAQQIRKGETDTLDVISGRKAGAVSAERAEELLAALDWGLILRRANDLYDRQVAALKNPTRTARESARAKLANEIDGIAKAASKNAAVVRAAIAAGGDPEPAARTAISEAVLSTLLLILSPANERMQAAADRNAQQFRLTRLAFALAAHRVATGAYPEALAALAPKYVTAVEPDLFTSKPLAYKRTADGYLLYSVGPNETDDGGRLSTSDPTGDDIAVRMPPAGT